MNTKKLFMLLAAVLLGSVSAMAQSGNNEPMKGDVNEDGTVDVADLVNVIKIMKDAGGAVGEKMCYWYAGTNNGNAVTADNFTDVASRIPENEIPETGSVTANGQYVYFVMPDTKHLASLDGANGASIDFDYTDALGYRIYKTESTINGTIYYTVEQTKYYWYIGAENPSSIDTINLQNSTEIAGWHKIGFSTNGFNIIFNNQNKIEFEDKTQYHLIIPNELHVYDATGGLNVETLYFNPVTCYIKNYKAFQYHTSVYAVKGIIIKE